MNGLINAASADEVVLHYERSLVAGDTQHANNIRTAHTDLLSRFEAVDSRLAAKK
jgi:hypothetical protein